MEEIIGRDKYFRLIIESDYYHNKHIRELITDDKYIIKLAHNSITLTDLKQSYVINFIGAEDPFTIEHLFVWNKTKPVIENVWSHLPHKMNVSDETLEIEQTVDYYPNYDTKQKFKKYVSYVTEEFTNCTRFLITLVNKESEILSTEYYSVFG
jgi:hypothetical protein